MGNDSLGWDYEIYCTQMWPEIEICATFVPGVSII